MTATDELTDKQSKVAHHDGRVKELEAEIVELEKQANLATEEYTVSIFSLCIIPRRIIIRLIQHSNGRKARNTCVKAEG